MKKQQNGSAHIIIIVILAIAVIGLLGFVFYQNFIVKKSDPHTEVTSTAKTTQTKSDSGKNTLDKDFSITLGSRTMTMNYPSSWTVATVLDNSSEKDIDHQISKTITSPDGKYVIKASLADGGFGGTCSNAGTFASTKLTDMPNGTGEFLLEYTVDATSGGGAASLVVEPKTVDRSTLTAGQDVCNTTIALFGANGEGMAAVGSNSALATVRANPGSFPLTTAQQQAWAADENYQVTRQILLSLKG